MCSSRAPEPERRRGRTLRNVPSLLLLRRRWWRCPRRPMLLLRLRRRLAPKAAGCMPFSSPSCFWFTATGGPEPEPFADTSLPPRPASPLALSAVPLPTPDNAAAHCWSSHAPRSRGSGNRCRKAPPFAHSADLAARHFAVRACAVRRTDPTGKPRGGARTTRITHVLRTECDEALRAATRAVAESHDWRKRVECSRGVRTRARQANSAPSPLSISLRTKRAQLETPRRNWPANPASCAARPPAAHPPSDAPRRRRRRPLRPPQTPPWPSAALRLRAAPAADAASASGASGGESGRLRWCETLGET